MVRSLNFIDDEGEEHFSNIGFDDLRNYILPEAYILNQLKPYNSFFREKYNPRHN